LLGAEDKTSVLAYLSSPACGLFRDLADAAAKADVAGTEAAHTEQQQPQTQQLAVRTVDVSNMCCAAGDGAAAVQLMQRLDAQGRQFVSFEALVAAVVFEASRAPAASASLDARQCKELLTFLAAEPTLLAAPLRQSGALERSVSKADLQRLLWATISASGAAWDLTSGGGSKEALCVLFTTLRDLRSFGELADTHRWELGGAWSKLPASDFAQLLRAAEANAQRLKKLQRQLLLYVRSSMATSLQQVTLADVRHLMFAGSNAGSLAQTHVQALMQQGRSFAEWSALEDAVQQEHQRWEEEQARAAAKEENGAA